MKRKELTQSLKYVASLQKRIDEYEHFMGDLLITLSLNGQHEFLKTDLPMADEIYRKIKQLIANQK